MLKHEFKLANLASSMAELDTYKDKVIVFEAIKTSDTSRLVTRQPLQPTNTQIPSSPRPSSNKSTSIKAGLEGDRNENGTRPVAMPSAPWSPDRISKSPRSLSQTSGVTSQASALPHSSVSNRFTPHPANHAASSDHRPHSIKHEPTVETKLHDVPTMVKPPITTADFEDQKQKSFQLQALLKDAGPALLESSVEHGVKLLDQLKAPLLDKMGNSPDAEQWIQQIDLLIKQAVKTKTIIGVVGNTGAGKSSVINAMLDEERLVPTNCMRACTAVVTEISYNHEDKPYRAQIEFISPADWEKELRTLFQDLLDGDGKVSRDCANEDTDAGMIFFSISLFPFASFIGGLKSPLQHLSGAGDLLWLLRHVF